MCVFFFCFFFFCLFFLFFLFVFFVFFSFFFFVFFFFFFFFFFLFFFSHFSIAITSLWEERATCVYVCVVGEVDGNLSTFTANQLQPGSRCYS